MTTDIKKELIKILTDNDFDDETARDLFKIYEASKLICKNKLKESFDDAECWKYLLLFAEAVKRAQQQEILDIIDG